MSRSRPQHKQKDAAGSGKSAEERSETADVAQESEGAEGTDLSGLYELLAKVTAERDQAKDQLLRAMADMQNQRRRFQAERESFHKFAIEHLLRDLLPVLDNFERTIEAGRSGASLEALLEGVSAADRQFRSVLAARQFGKIPAEGEAFDPALHEAVATEVSEDVPEGTITQELQPGYRIEDIVVRPSKVKVAKKP